ncbi:hypothetical protein N656DRAFT_775281 [Canariomyces notabilis]|uniref:Uncharacterized protein n=1 Tax=Canariomyces notabilis TaxID=2074819 RepID=A0AAN6TLZ6_9PEZI|nr:hypothetical protein N656DRAFT_775281 [Canariomyces arenarius]
MDIRKRTAFLGYEWRRMSIGTVGQERSAPGTNDGQGGARSRNENAREGVASGVYAAAYQVGQFQAPEAHDQGHQCINGVGVLQCWGQDVSALRALHRGQWSLR